MSTIDERIDNACKLLSREAKELYLSERIAQVEDEIAPLKFQRDYISKNIPLLIKNGIGHWKALEKWSASYFRETMPDKKVTVAVTPNGYADAIATNDKNGREYFVKPEERTIKVSEFLDRLESWSDDDDKQVFYIQSQNSNFEKEYSQLWRDVERDLPWATEAFGKDPDAINFWMGDHRAVTSMHKDPYENIYCVVSGEKEFILHPPTDLPWIPYEKYPSATYRKLEDDGGWIVDPDKPLQSESAALCDDHLIPWISIDPLKPDYKRFPRYKNVHTLRVKLQAGDVLYLPSLWFHHVRQSHGCIALNYWYDMEYDIKYAYYLALESLCNK